MSKKNKRNSSRNPSDGNPAGSDGKLAAKKAMVLGGEKKSRVPLIASVLALIVAAIGGYLMAGPGSDTVPAVTARPASAAPTTQYAYPVELFADGVARHFSHTHGNNTIRYFILKSADGVIRAAFDACDVCWPAGKGYAQEADVMVCRNCGRRFASVRINEVKGGCNPAPLNRSVIDGKVVVRIDDILSGEMYFDFSNRSSS